MTDIPIQNPGQAYDPNQKPTDFDFSKEKAKYDLIISDWAAEKEMTEVRRKLRANKRNVAQEQKDKKILPDETIIPDRTIDLNIRRGSVQYIQFVTKARRLLIMTENNDPQLSTESLELWFTRGMRYPKWKTPWFKHIDSMMLHGGSALEVVYDPSKPFNCGIEVIPRARLLMPLRTADLQANPCLLRSYDITTIQLDEMAERYGFDPVAVKAIRDRYTDQTTFRTIYKVLSKKSGVVYSSWYSQDYPTGLLRDYRLHDIGLYELPDNIAEMALAPNWKETRMKLLPPEQPAIGMPDMTGMPVENTMGMMPTTGLPTQPGTLDPSLSAGTDIPAIGEFGIPSSERRSTTELCCEPKKLKEYPIFWFPYSVTEIEELLEEQGRASLDLHVQEALTHLLTNTVNSSTRASGIYASAESEPGQDAGLQELGKLKSGVIVSRKLTFFQPPWPAAIILSVMQALDVRKANESGNTDFAATARKDANKTATEMQLATEQSVEQAGVRTEMFSSSFLDVYALCFLIATHQAIFLLCDRPPDPTLLFGSYNLQPAGDIEIVKREEDKNNAKEFFNIIRGTPAADKLLIFLLEHFFPDQAEEWTAALNQGNKDQLIIEMANLLNQIPRDGLTPEQSQQLDTIISAAQSMVATSDNQGANQPPGGAQA